MSKLDRAVDDFAEFMKRKLDKAKQSGRTGWDSPSWSPEDISAALHEHVRKGDPTDVANFCMFLAYRGEPIHPAPAAPGPAASSAVPKGYALVPLVLTEHMHAAAVRAAINSSGNDDLPPNVWAAMLGAAASPALAPEQTEPAKEEE